MRNIIDCQLESNVLYCPYVFSPAQGFLEHGIMSGKLAVVVCPEGESSKVGTPLLGLTVGERVLLALQYAGVSKIAFAGAGERPFSDRVDVQVVSLKSLLEEGEARQRGVFILPADLVFDRGLISGQVPLESHLSVKRIPGSEALTIAQNPESWLQSLDENSKAKGVGFALRVLSKSSWKMAKRCLLLSLRKPLDGFISRNLNRYISTFISSYLVRTGIRPNQLTFFIMLIGMCSGVFAACAEYWWALVLAGFCFQGQSVMDGCDGEIARLTYRFSKSGQWLDTIGDDLTNYSFYIGLFVGLARVNEQPWFYLIGGITCVFQWAMSITMYQRIYKMGTGDLLAIPIVVASSKAKQGEGTFGKIVGVLYKIVKKDFFTLILSVIIAVQFPLIAFVAMTVGTYPAFFGIFANELRLRKMERDGKTIEIAS
jgi:phosphatidylglycerophosphate synthase